MLFSPEQKIEFHFNVEITIQFHKVLLMRCTIESVTNRQQLFGFDVLNKCLII